jgi:hypothetical protein
MNEMDKILLDVQTSTMRHVVDYLEAVRDLVEPDTAYKIGLKDGIQESINSINELIVLEDTKS